MARGVKTGGRTKGTRNKATAKKAQEIAASGLTPLDYMLSVMRNPRTKAPRRDEMAKAAAPYVHPRLASLTNPKGDGPCEISLIERVIVRARPKAADPDG